jgi:type II restriction/modification system DNA methylase subunit YeeA
MGVTPAGPFDIPEELARTWMATPSGGVRPPNSDVLRPYYNGIDLTQQVRRVWIVDFGTTMSQEQAAAYYEPFEYVQRVVKPLRDNNKRASYRKFWWRHAEARPAMRAALEPLDRYIGTSMVSKHHIFVWIPAHVLPANLIILVARSDDYFMGMLQSWLHELWSRKMGTQLREAESGYRYTPTTTFETFPFPWPPGTEPTGEPRVQAIAAAAKDLVEQRDAWLHPPGLAEAELKKRTLTNLYNERPAWLDAAHKRLDAAVFDAYGWPHDLTDEEILARLLALNLERAAKQA